MRKGRLPEVILALIIVILAFAALLGGCGGVVKGVQRAVGATGDGVSASCTEKDIPGDTSFSANRLTRSEAASRAPLPEAEIFLAAGEFGPDGMDTPGTITLTFALEHHLKPGWELPVWSITDGSWQDTGERALVSGDGRTASIRVSHLAAYALFLDENWKSVAYQGQNLVTRSNDIPATELGENRVMASGKVDDAVVIARVMEITGYNEEEVRSLLRSWDTRGDRVVQVLELQEEVYVSRYTSTDPADKLGRWYSPSEKDAVRAPDRARSMYALPVANTALDCTLYKMKPGTMVIYGICSDMTWNQPVFGPDSTGGGAQLYAPQATRKVADHIEVNPDVMELVAELRYVEGGE